MDGQLPHRLILQDQHLLTVTGVTEVLGFEDTAVLLRTGRGLLQIRGRELKMKSLVPEGGQMAVEGEIQALSYEQGASRESWLHRLLR